MPAEKDSRSKMVEDRNSVSYFQGKRVFMCATHAKNDAKKDRSTARHTVSSIQWRRNLFNRSQRDNDDSTIQENPLYRPFRFFRKMILRVEF